MPKIIDSIENKIITAAFNLFSEKGYDNVSMKIIAKEVGIAVGTLYNYHSNKQELFLKVLKQNFKQTYIVLCDIVEKDGSTREFITALYDETVRIQQFIEEIISNKSKYEVIKNSSKHKQEIMELRKNLLAVMSEIIGKIADKKNLDMPEKVEKRLIRVLLLSIVSFVKEFPDEREENIDFVSNLVFY